MQGSTEALQTTYRSSSKRAATGTVSVLNVIRSEWIKLWSVRSTLWTVLAMFVTTVGLSAIFSAMVAASDDPALDAMRLDPTNTSLSGISLGQIVIVVLGVLTITAEYTTGSIRSSSIAVPQRLKLLGSKVVVLAPVALVTGIVTSFAAFLVGQAILTTGGSSAELGDASVLRAVLGGGLFLMASAMFGFALGAVLRSTATAIVVAVAALMILPELAGQLPGAWGNWVHKLFTSNAGQQILTVNPVSGQLGRWTGYMVFTLWWLAILAFGAILMLRRDA